MKSSESELTPKQRLQQIEILLATAAKKINQIADKQDNLAEKQDRIAEQQARLAERQDRIAEQQALNSQLINQNAQAIEKLRVNVAQTVDLFTDSLKVIQTMQVNIETMQAEVKGMQIENQRILRHLFGEND